MAKPLDADLDPLLLPAVGPWERLEGARIFVTGGTGFFGAWLLESLLRAHDRLRLGLAVTVLTRDPEAFRRARPHLASHAALSLRRGDVLTLEPFGGDFTHVLHAATPASARINADAPRLMFETVVEGTRRVLEVTRRCGARRFLLTSSGAVYGRQPPELSHVPEEYAGAPDTCSPASAYGEGKRAAELLCAMAARAHGFDAIIARCFAFSGPYLPLDEHFAIGNFVRDALAGGPIRVGGDGTPRRSYLYGADLAYWLWSLLARGESARPYNVGSEREVSIAELAETVASVLGVARGVEIAKAPDPRRTPERYVPSTRRIREELGLTETVPLEVAIRRMADSAGGR
ncbi:MAG: NAD-dependent epimerase/dehydratase family protein [Anaeromyxobacteraceae bacterium]